MCFLYLSCILYLVSCIAVSISISKAVLPVLRMITRGLSYAVPERVRLRHNGLAAIAHRGPVQCLTVVDVPTVVR